MVKLTKTGAYEWNDGSIGRHSDGFRGGQLCLFNSEIKFMIVINLKFPTEPPSGTDLCLTMWLDFDRPDGSWNEWDCSYASGYSSLCKKSFKRVTPIPAQVLNPHVHHSRRCCVSALCSNRCTPSERCIPDDLDCWTKTCQNTGPGWCLPAP
ncbi:unnamed protein product [Anisakis simplex]|uniref:C-type lectin domain-containing protein n=1 Tax=Anisakis simplex TaxID=6269 RepID=A0A3P6QNQ4_ANISI|nr:unnamed protein product [Anisakis simplex]